MHVNVDNLLSTAVLTCRRSSASRNFLSMNSWEIERSLGGELDEICGGFSAAAGFRITSNAKPPAFVLGLSANYNHPTKAHYL